MGDDRGVELSRKAIKAARIDLEEALYMLSPDAEGAKQGGTGTVKPIFTESGPALQLSGDYDAMAGFWPAAMGFRQSTANATTHVTGTYANITGQVANVIGLLKQAMQNYDDVEVDGEGRSGQVQV